jgi:hypothetical protein
MPYCQNCGSKYQEGSKFCQSCGHKLDTIPTAHHEDTSISKIERWTGEYTYDKSGFFSSLLNPRHPIAFSADLVFDGNKLSGTIKEGNTFLTQYGEDHPRYLIANISGYIDGDVIVFNKKYDGGGGYQQTVEYKGKFDAEGGKIFGTWTLSRYKGKFEMSRIAKVLPTSLLLVL